MPAFEIRCFSTLEYQAKEALNTLSTNLSFAGGDIKKIMVTSCHPQEGKSFVSMNLMRSFAEQGMRVVLIDADIRASMLQLRYDIQISGLREGERYPGLTRYLAGRCGVDDVLARTNIPNAWMILAGSTVKNSLPFFNTPRLKNLLDALSQRFDVILIDVPPIGTIIDAAKIAPLCDGTLVVVQSNAISHSHLTNALRQIEKTGCPLLGTVLNQFDNRTYSDKYYYQNSYYSKYNPESLSRGRALRPGSGKSR